MRMHMILACTAVLVFAGCSFRQKKELTVSECRGSYEYAVETLNPPFDYFVSASFRVYMRPTGECETRSVKLNCIYYTPYKIRKEFASFRVGLFELAIIPVVIPLSVLEAHGRQSKMYLTYWLVPFYDMNIFMAKPRYGEIGLLFLPCRRTPTYLRVRGEPLERTEWNPATETEIPVANTEIHIRVDALNYSDVAISDEGGYIEYETLKPIEYLLLEGQEFADFSGTLTIKDRNGKDAGVIPITLRLTRKKENEEAGK